MAIGQESRAMGLVLGLYVARYGTLRSRSTLLSCTTHSIIPPVAILSQCQKAVDGHVAWVRAISLVISAGAYGGRFTKQLQETIGVIEI
jgi:hypothetical protein